MFFKNTVVHIGQVRDKGLCLFFNIFFAILNILAFAFRAIARLFEYFLATNPLTFLTQQGCVTF